MVSMKLAEVPLSGRVSIEVHLLCGGQAKPEQLRNMGLLLQAIASATEKWQREGLKPLRAEEQVSA